jgi:hypothetical protein
MQSVRREKYLGVRRGHKAHEVEAWWLEKTSERW